jgi:transposase InsO family protein
VNLNSKPWIRYTERLLEAEIEASVGSIGDSYDTALVDTVNALLKAKVSYRRSPWRSAETVEFATFERVNRLDNRRVLEPIRNIPPADAEAYYNA